MAEDLDPLSPLARRALEAEKRRGDVDASMEGRILARVVTSVAVLGAATVAGNAAASAGGAASKGGAAAAGLTGKALPWITLAFFVGGGTGAALHAALAEAPRPAVAPSAVASPPAAASFVGHAAGPLERSSGPDPSVVSAPPVAISALPSANPTPMPSALAHGPVTPHASSSSEGASGGSDVDLAGERALIDRARAALGRGQSDDALTALEAHAKKYPHGRLVEEREALSVDALARAGRLDAARARASRFRAMYPNSVFGAFVDDAVAPR